jgi:hypothetical protein
MYGSPGWRLDHWGVTFISKPAFTYVNIDEAFVVGPPPEALAAYDWDGTPLELDAPAPARRSGLFWEVGGEDLARLYRTQLVLGLTSAASESPYA